MMTAIADAPAVAPAVECPEPGVYRDVPGDEYRAWRAASNSELKIIAEFSPMHADYRRRNPPEPTPALAFGSAVHCAILEPDKFEAEYTVAAQCCAMKKTGGGRCEHPGLVRDSGGNWFCGVHGKGIADTSIDQKVITADQAEAIQNIVRAVSFNPAAHNLLRSPGDNELSAVFDHAENGQRSKLRTDGWRPQWETVLDIKTTENASRNEFTRSLTDYGYHRQGAFYIDGLRSLGVKVNHFAIIAVEKVAPYGVAVYRLMEDALDAGREELKKLIRIYKNCATSKPENWYGYANEFQDISITSWRMRQIINNEF